MRERNFLKPFQVGGDFPKQVVLKTDAAVIL
jgi:hypothetical protein